MHKSELYNIQLTWFLALQSQLLPNSNVPELALDTVTIYWPFTPQLASYHSHIIMLKLLQWSIVTWCLPCPPSPGQLKAVRLTTSWMIRLKHSDRKYCFNTPIRVFYLGSSFRACYPHTSLPSLLLHWHDCSLHLLKSGWP